MCLLFLSTHWAQGKANVTSSMTRTLIGICSNQAAFSYVPLGNKCLSSIRVLCPTVHGAMSAQNAVNFSNAGSNLPVKVHLKPQMFNLILDNVCVVHPLKDLQLNRDPPPHKCPSQPQFGAAGCGVQYWLCSNSRQLLWITALDLGTQSQVGKAHNSVSPVLTLTVALKAKHSPLAR